MRLNNSINLQNKITFKAQSERPDYNESNYANILNKEYKTLTEIEADHDRFVNSEYNTKPFANADKFARCDLDDYKELKEIDENKKENFYKRQIKNWNEIILAAILLGTVVILNKNNSNYFFNQKIDEVAEHLNIMTQDVTNDGKNELVLPVNKTDTTYIDFSTKNIIENTRDEQGELHQTIKSFDDFFNESGLTYKDMPMSGESFTYKGKSYINLADIEN